MRVGWAGAIAGMAVVGAATAGAAPVQFRLTPEVRDGAARALDVEIRLRADRSGRTVLDLPDSSTGRKERWRFISDLTVQGAAVKTAGPAKRVLRSRPYAPLVVRYRVLSAYAADPKGEDGNPYDGAAIRPTWFSSLGDYLFVTPEGRDGAPASFRWGPLPAGWSAASDLDEPPAGKPLTVADVVNSTLLGGADVKLYERPIQGGALRVAIRGAWAFPEARLVDDVAATVDAQRRFWGGSKGGYFVSVVALATSPANISVGGTGKFDGFALYGTSNADEATLRRILAHEHTHNWIPFAMGTMEEGPQQPGVYWLSEGFTDFYTDRSLLRSGLWARQDFVRHLNEVLRAYDLSPVRAAPNARIVADFWKDETVEQLPYQRGYLLAFLWDRKMRRATAGRAGLDQVMFAMRDRFAAAPGKAKPELIAAFARAALEVTGVDVRPDIARYAVGGEPIDLPSDLFDGCATLASTTVPIFELGFDLTATRAKGAFAGVDPSGPAYRAGIREGMRRLGAIAGAAGDSRVEIAYRVQDLNGVEREIRYRPEGRTSVTFQEAALIPADAEHDAACRASMSGQGPDLGLAR